MRTLKIFLITGLVSVAINCATTPVQFRTPTQPSVSFEGKSVASLVLNNYSSENSETAAIAAAVLSVTKSPKVVPDLPEPVKPIPTAILNEVLKFDLNKTDLKIGANIDELVKAIGKFGAFDLLVILSAEATQIRTSIFGIVINSDPAILVKATVYDSKEKRFLSAGQYPKRIFDTSKSIDIPLATRTGLTQIIVK
jgi:hypothetical protein